MITMENMMLILLLITTSKCSNATTICLERNLTHCYHQDDDGRCTSCDNGYYGPTCSNKCIGECDFGCDMNTGFCGQCKDTYYTESCMVNCSDTCGGQLCDRYTGDCTNGCEKGHCSKFCKTPCDESCKDKECDFISCKCQRCNDGFVCKEAAEGPNCTQCVKNRDCVKWVMLSAKRRIKNSFHVIWIWSKCLRIFPRTCLTLKPKLPWGTEIKIKKDIRIHGDYFTQRYIATQQPVDKTQNDFWTMAWKYKTKVIVWLTSKQTSEFDRHLQNQKCSRTYGNIRIRHIKQNKETKSNCRINELKIKHVKKNEGERDVTLYQFCGWFQEKSFCDFVMKVREDPNYETSPIVVFSKDGEGPTAVFLALDRYIDKTMREANLHVDSLFVGVNDIARHRRGMFVNKENIERIVKCHGHLNLLRGSIQPSPVPSEESTTKIICHGGLVFLIVVYFISAIALILYDHVG